MTLKDGFYKYKDLIYLLISLTCATALTSVSIFVTWKITKNYADKQFEEWQIKVANATSKNIMLELKTCDTTLRTIGEKVDKIKSKTVPETELTLEYFDNVKNEMVTLKDVINNSKSLWELMFPAYTETKEYKDASQKVRQLDGELLTLIGKIKDLQQQLTLKETTGDIEGLKVTTKQYRDATNNYGQIVQSYKGPAVVYPSNVVSPDSVATGTVVLSDGSVFNPYREYEALLSPVAKDKNDTTEEQKAPDLIFQQTPNQEIKQSQPAQ